MNYDSNIKMKLIRLSGFVHHTFSIYYFDL